MSLLRLLGFLGVLLGVLVAIAWRDLAGRQARAEAVPADVWRCLREAKTVTLYAVREWQEEEELVGIACPPGQLVFTRFEKVGPDEKEEVQYFKNGVRELVRLPMFQGYRVAGRVEIGTPAERKMVTETIEMAVLKGDDRADCFAPRHALRISDGVRTCDLLVCFSCNALRWSCEGGGTGMAAIRGSSADFDAMLRGAGVPVGEEPDEAEAEAMGSTVLDGGSWTMLSFGPTAAGLRAVLGNGGPIGIAFLLAETAIFIAALLGGSWVARRGGKALLLCVAFLPLLLSVAGALVYLAEVPTYEWYVEWWKEYGGRAATDGVEDQELAQLLMRIDMVRTLLWSGVIFSALTLGAGLVSRWVRKRRAGAGLT